MHINRTILKMKHDVNDDSCESQAIEKMRFSVRQFGTGCL